MDYTVDSFVNKMFKAVIGISVIMMVAGIAIFRSYFGIQFAIGVGVAMVLNLVKIKWLKYCVTQAVSMETARGGAFIGIHYILRFVLTGLVLAATHFLPFVDMFGAVVGLLAMPFANYAVHFFSISRNKTATDEETPKNDMEEEPLS